ncbi:MAG TPA: hypothetical protein VJ738_08200 [Steroidobacteraceae bacterium]|nr:hypothetical protein [Steroidobacteraceae bacterium]
MSIIGNAIRSVTTVVFALLAAQACESAQGGVSPASQADVRVDASRTLGTISRDAVGTNLAIWYRVTDGRLPAEIASLEPRILRWPGGSTADAYHWRTHTNCGTLKREKNQSKVAYDPRSTFDNFMHDVVIPGGYDVAISVNYGSNEACNGGGDPREAAAWVAYAKREGYDKYIKYWTVGNEEYGGWEFDLHSQPHDPMTYAQAVSGPSGYYALMKAADPRAKIGILATGQDAFHGWDRVVLAHAPYDFVELHDYAQLPGKESDSYLLEQGPQDLARRIDTLRGELAVANKADTPLMLGEFNSVAYSPGKQSMSIVNALYTGLAYGEVLNENLAVATWWFGAGGTQLCRHINLSSDLYGWQNYGGYDLVAANASSAWNGCRSGPVVPEGALFPSGDAFSMVSRFAQPGARMLAVTVSPDLADIRAYADALSPHGYGIMLFNLNESASRKITLAIANSPQASYSATTLTYDKRLYDQSRQNIWLQPQSASLGTVGATPTLTLPPWSMTLLTLH